MNGIESQTLQEYLDVLANWPIIVTTITLMIISYMASRILVQHRKEQREKTIARRVEETCKAKEAEYRRAKYKD